MRPTLHNPSRGSQAYFSMFNESGRSGALDESAEALAARLRREIEERDDVLSMIAHELRNPLHALSLQLALARSTARSHQQPDTAARIAKAQATLERYVDRVSVLLELARLNADTYPLRKAPVDLTVVLTALAQALEAEGQFHGVRLIAQLPASCPALTDQLVVEQIVENLLLNAFKHAACSTVTLSLRAIAAGRAEIEVADDGTGIGTQDQDRALGKVGISAAAALTHDGKRGAAGGFGLWIVRKLLDVMGGSVTLTSQPGAGCVFTVRFPLSDRHEPIT